MENFVDPILFIASILLLTLVSKVAYARGNRDKALGKPEHSELITTSIFGLLALLLSFSYSMAVSRYEHRRELVVDESNAISTAYIRGTLLKGVPGVDLQRLHRQYLDSRIRFYDENYSKEESIKTRIIQEEIESHLRELTQTERGALESSYTFALTEMFDTSNARNFALIKTIPTPIYFIILFIAVAGFGAFSYDRGYKTESIHGKLLIFIVIFSLLFTLIYDIDHSNKGLISISQDSMLLLQAHLK